MGRNEAGLNRGIRGVAAFAAVVAARGAGPTSGAGIALVVAAVVMVGTSATGFCRLHRLFGIGTRRVPAGR